MNEKFAVNKTEFCARHSISKSSFYNMRPEDRPVTMLVNEQELISIEAEAKWRREREVAARARREAAAK